MCAKNQGLVLQLVGIKLPSAAEVQPSSHWSGVWWKCAGPPWCTDNLGDIRWESCCWEVHDKIAANRLNQSQIGCSKFVPGSWSRCTDCENYDRVYQQGTITKNVAPSCASLISTLPTTLNGEKIQEWRPDHHREKAFTLYYPGRVCMMYT